MSQNLVQQPLATKQVYEVNIIDVQPIGVAQVCLDDAGSGPAWTVRVHMVVKTRSKVKNA